MSSHRRVLSRDEELGKRDDDFRPRSMNSPALNVVHSWRRRKRWRFVAVFLALVLLYYLVRNIPADLEPIDDEYARVAPQHGGSSPGVSKEPAGSPPRSNANLDAQRSMRYYDGKIRFYRLASSLHAISRTWGTRPNNRNVLFAASSLKSLANLIPLACQMGVWDRNFVHLAILGRDNIPLEDILEINGVTAEQCNFYLHDARSDYSEYSTDTRAGLAVAGAMRHINDFMHPQAIVMDDASLEDDFFVHAMRAKTEDMRRPLIEIPAGKYADFEWMTKLDSGSLASWHAPTIDLLIHAPPQSSGGLLRVVKSLQEADYAGLKPPRLTIELPSDLDSWAERYLRFLQWPPDSVSSPLKTNTLTLRHRIPSSRLNPEEASLRFLESFYPSNMDDNHVVLISPQAELTPSFFHYIYYTILEYRYSAFAPVEAENLLGVSLDVPDALIDGKTTLDRPKVKDMSSKRYTEEPSLDKSTLVPFLYGAPSSTASLVFGDKWALFHGFLKRRIAANQAGVAAKSEKLVTEAEPSWMEYLLELMRAKGWYMLHPGSPLVTIHNDLARIPDEFRRPEKDNTDQQITELAQPSSDEPFLTAADPPVVLHRTEPDHTSFSPLHEILPFEGDLPELQNLPFVDHIGNKRDISAPQLSRMQYASYFRKSVGGCSEADADRPRVVPLFTTDELFCLPDMDVEFDETPEFSREEEIAEAIVEATEPIPPPAPEDLGPEDIAAKVDEWARVADAANAEAVPPSNDVGLG